MEDISHVRKNLVTWGFFTIYFQLFSGKQRTKTIELFQNQFYFWLIPRFFVNLIFTVLQNHFFIHHDFFQEFLKSCCKYLNSKEKILLHFEFLIFLYLAIVCCVAEVELWHMPKFIFLYSPSLS